MSYVPEVTARWKRRATEIADAIGGGESSSTVSGTVSLSAASITALADAIDDRLRLSAIAVSIADVLSVKTNVNDSVAVTGTVSATLPANLVIPVDTVAGTNNGANGSGVAVTVPVNPTHNVTVPVKANSANQPMSSAGIPVTVPVNPTHTVTVPVKSNVSGQPLTLGNVVAQIGVAVGSTTVPVSVVTNTSQGASVFGTGVNVPVSGGLATIPVSNASGLTVQISNASGLVCDIANTNSVVVPVDTVSGTNNAANGSGVAVVVPVTASGTVLDVKIVEISAVAPSGGVAPITAFHEAVETALEDAEGITVNQNPTLLYGVCEGYSGNYMLVRSDDDGVTYNANTIRISGTSPEVDVASYANSGFSAAEKYQLRGLRVSSTYTDALTYARNWRTVDFFPHGLQSGITGHITSRNSSTVADSWEITTDNGIIHSSQRVTHEGASLDNTNTSVRDAFYGSRVVWSTYLSRWLTAVIEV